MNFTTVLDNARQQYRASLDTGTLALVDRAIAELSDSGITAQSLRVGDQVANFALPNTANQTIELYQLLAQGSVVVSFFRGMWCPFCNLELKGLEQAFPAIQSLGATLIAISPQKQRYSLATVEEHKLTFNVLNDQGNQVARQFGIVYQLPAYLRPVFEQGGYPLPRYNGDESFELSIPATFVVNREGKIIYAFASSDYTRRADPIEVVTTLRKATS